MAAPEIPPTPELDKQAAAREAGSQAIGEFLEWLQGRGLEICKYVEEFEEYVPDYASIEQRLAAYFEIDLNKVETERRALLDAIRTANEKEG